jgi:hypothetical protein
MKSAPIIEEKSVIVEQTCFEVGCHFNFWHTIAFSHEQCDGR